MLVCKECGRECKSLQSIKVHLRRAHNVKYEDYLIKYEYGGAHPVCECGCGQKVRYHKGSFRKYLQGHFLRVQENKERVFTDEALQKRKETCKKKYGGNAPASSLVVREKMKKTNLRRFGGVAPASSQSVQEKMRQTMLKNYGVNNASKSKELRQKIKSTCLKRYGVDNPAKFDNVKLKIRSKNLLTFGEIQRRGSEKGYRLLSESYAGCRELLMFECEKHKKIFHSSVFNVSQNAFSQCPDCRLKGKSKAEEEISEFIESFGLSTRRNVYDLITPKEVDVFVLSRNLAVEHHGIYWHSEIFNPLVSQTLFYEKFLKCREKKVRLLQFYEDEWRDKKGICESMIKNALGKIGNKVAARKCEIVEDHREVKNFVDSNHLQGHTNFIKSFSLVKDDKIVCCMTLRKPFYKAANTIEVARFCSKKNLIVLGGFSRILKRVKQWCMASKISALLTYSDCRYSFGDTYRKQGFNFDGHTGVDYFYTDGICRFNRFKFRAQKNKSEKVVAKENGVYKIYGAGHYRWVCSV